MPRISKRDKEIKDFMEKYNKIWKKNYPYLYFTEVLINLPRFSGKKVQEMTDEEILESMEELRKIIDKETVRIDNSKKLISEFQDLWINNHKSASFSEVINSIWQVLNHDLSSSADEHFLKQLNKYKEKMGINQNPKKEIPVIKNIKDRENFFDMYNEKFESVG